MRRSGRQRAARRAPGRPRRRGPRGAGSSCCARCWSIAAAALRALLRALGESWIDDPANDDPRFARALARRRLAGRDATAPPAGRGAGAAGAGWAMIRQGLAGELAVAAGAAGDAPDDDDPPRRSARCAALRRRHARAPAAARLAGPDRRTPRRRRGLHRQPGRRPDRGAAASGCCSAARPASAVRGATAAGRLCRSARASSTAASRSTAPRAGAHRLRSAAAPRGCRPDQRRATGARPGRRARRAAGRDFAGGAVTCPLLARSGRRRCPAAGVAASWPRRSAPSATRRRCGA